MKDRRIPANRNPSGCRRSSSKKKRRSTKGRRRCAKGVVKTGARSGKCRQRSRSSTKGRCAKGVVKTGPRKGKCRQRRRPSTTKKNNSKTSGMPVVTYVPAVAMTGKPPGTGSGGAGPSGTGKTRFLPSAPPADLLPGGTVPNDAVVGIPADAVGAAVDVGSSSVAAPVGMVTDPLSVPGNIGGAGVAVVRGTVDVAVAGGEAVIAVPVDLVTDPLGLVPGVVDNIRGLAARTYEVPNSTLAAIGGNATVGADGNVSYEDPGDVPIMMHLHKSHPDTYNPSVYFFTRPQRHDAASQLDEPDQIVMYYGVITDHEYSERMEACNHNPYATIRKANVPRIPEEYALDGSHKLLSVAHNIASRTRAGLGYGVAAARVIGYGQQYASESCNRVLGILAANGLDAVVDRITERVENSIARGGRGHPEFADPSFVRFTIMHSILCELGRMKMHARYFRRDAVAPLNSIVDSVDWISLDGALGSVTDEDLTVLANVFMRVTPGAAEVNDPKLAYALLMEFYMGLGSNHMQQDLYGRYARPIKDIGIEAGDARINDTSHSMETIGHNPLRFLSDAYGDDKPVFIPEYLASSHLDPERTTQLFNTGMVLFAPRNLTTRKRILNERCASINNVLRGILDEQGRLGAFPFLERRPASGVSDASITICVLVYLARRPDIDFKPFSDALMSEELRGSTFILVDNLVTTVRRDRIPSDLNDDGMVLYATLMEFLHGLGPGFVAMPEVALEIPAGAVHDPDEDEDDEAVGGMVEGEPVVWF